ncbi:hypothetical protein TrVE_jg6684 [Triparma verrucosa]|uniref:Uncharacterized protein n=1 Tax=Triparma verrucosa TaxID=1606542 RepID=A0A9W7FA54_9STRA|nr:hypothetical protein TrVE_jg6684 [Triparma verrucosa]
MGKRPAQTSANLPPVSVHARIASVIDGAMESIDQALGENEVVRSSFRSLYDTTIEQYEFERDKVDREIARLPPTLAEYEKIKALERAQDLEAGGGAGAGGVSHSLAFHLQKPEDTRDIFEVDGGLDDQPLSFQQSAIDSRFPSPNRSTRGGERERKRGSTVAGGSVVSKKISKQEKEEAKAWDTYDKFVNREEMFAKIADIQRMEQEIEVRLASDNLTDRETAELKRELDRTAMRYSKYVLNMVGEYKPKLTATKMNGKDMHELRDLSYLGVGMGGSVAEMVSQMDPSYMMGEGGMGGEEDDDDDMIYDDDDYEDDGDGGGPEMKAGNYDMPDPQAWLRQQEEEKKAKAVAGRSGSPTSNLSGLEQADAAFDELNAFVANAMAESEQVAINDPFHLTNMQDLPIVRPSAPDRGASRGGSREGGRVGTATRDIIQANTNHVDPYFPSLESFKTKEQDNAEYFMPGFQGKNFFKGVPQSAGAYWTAGRARAREKEEGGGKKKKKKKKGRKGRKGKKGRKKKNVEEEDEDYGEGDWGEEEDYGEGNGFEEGGEGEGEGEGEIDEEAKAEIERLKKWKEEMKAYYGAGKGKGEGEEGGESGEGGDDDATVDSIVKELPNPEQEHLYYEAAKISGKRALLTVSAASPTGGRQGIKIQAIDVAEADSSPKVIKLEKDKVERLFGDIESMTDEEKKGVGRELSGMLVFLDDGELALNEEKKEDDVEAEKEEKEEEVVEPDTEVEEMKTMVAKIASDITQVAEEKVGEKVVVEGGEEGAQVETGISAEKLSKLASEMADGVLAEVEQQLSHTVIVEEATPQKTAKRLTVTKIVVPSPKQEKRRTLISAKKEGETFTERLLHHAAVYTDELGNTTNEPQATDTFVASVMDGGIAARLSSISLAGADKKEEDVENVENVEEGKGEEKKEERKKDAIEEIVGAIISMSVDEIVKEKKGQ